MRILWLLFCLTAVGFAGLGTPPIREEHIQAFLSVFGSGISDRIGQLKQTSIFLPGNQTENDFKVLLKIYDSYSSANNSGLLTKSFETMIRNAMDQNRYNVYGLLDKESPDMFRTETQWNAILSSEFSVIYLEIYQISPKQTLTYEFIRDIFTFNATKSPKEEMERQVVEIYATNVPKQQKMKRTIDIIGTCLPAIQCVNSINISAVDVKCTFESFYICQQPKQNQTVTTIPGKDEINVFVIVVFRIGTEMEHIAKKLDNSTDIENATEIYWEFKKEFVQLLLGVGKFVDPLEMIKKYMSAQCKDQFSNGDGFVYCFEVYRIYMEFWKTYQQYKDYFDQLKDLYLRLVKGDTKVEQLEIVVKLYARLGAKSPKHIEWSREYLAEIKNLTSLDQTSLIKCEIEMYSTLYVLALMGYPKLNLDKQKEHQHGLCLSRNGLVVKSIDQSTTTEIPSTITYTTVDYTTTGEDTDVFTLTSGSSSPPTTLLTQVPITSVPNGSTRPGTATTTGSVTSSATQTPDTTQSATVTTSAAGTTATVTSSTTEATLTSEATTFATSESPATTSVAQRTTPDYGTTTDRESTASTSLGHESSTGAFGTNASDTSESTYSATSEGTSTTSFRTTTPDYGTTTERESTASTEFGHGAFGSNTTDTSDSIASEGTSTTSTMTTTPHAVTTIERGTIETTEFDRESSEGTSATSSISTTSNVPVSSTTATPTQKICDILTEIAEVINDGTISISVKFEKAAKLGVRAGSKAHAAFTYLVYLRDLLGESIFASSCYNDVELYSKELFQQLQEAFAKNVICKESWDQCVTMYKPTLLPNSAAKITKLRELEEFVKDRIFLDTDADTKEVIEIVYNVTMSTVERRELIVELLKPNANNSKNIEEFVITYLLAVEKREVLNTEFGTLLSDALLKQLEIVVAGTIRQGELQSLNLAKFNDIMEYIKNIYRFEEYRDVVRRELVSKWKEVGLTESVLITIIPHLDHLRLPQLKHLSKLLPTLNNICPADITSTTEPFDFTTWFEETSTSEPTTSPTTSTTTTTARTTTSSRPSVWIATANDTSSECVCPAQPASECPTPSPVSQIIIQNNVGSCPATSAGSVILPNATPSRITVEKQVYEYAQQYIVVGGALAQNVPIGIVSVVQNGTEQDDYSRKRRSVHNDDEDSFEEYLRRREKRQMTEEQLYAEIREVSELRHN